MDHVSITSPSRNLINNAEVTIKYKEITELSVNKHQGIYILTIISNDKRILIKSKFLEEGHFKTLFNELRERLNKVKFNIQEFEELPFHTYEKELKDLYPLHITLFIYACINFLLFILFFGYYITQIETVILTIPALITNTILLILAIKTMKKYKKPKKKVQLFALSFMLGVIFFFSYFGHLGLFSFMNQIGDSSKINQVFTTVSKDETQLPESIKENGICYKLVNFTEMGSNIDRDTLCDKEFEELKDGLEVTLSYKQGNLSSKWISDFKLGSSSKSSHK